MKNSERKVKLFNTPIEVGLRALLLLKEFYPSKLDLQRLVYFDYLLVNSGDITGAPPSLHAKVPYRSAALSIRRKELADGLELLISRELVEKTFAANDGISYSATDLAQRFLEYFSSAHFQSLVTRAKWIRDVFEGKDLNAVTDYFESNVGAWNPEFSRESPTRQDWFLRNDY